MNSSDKRFWLRVAAAVTLVSPLLIALPLHWWVFNRAGTLLVTTRLEPDHRAGHLAVAYFYMLQMSWCLSLFPGLLILYYSEGKRRVLKWLLLASLGLFIPGVLLAALFVESYFKFR